MAASKLTCALLIVLNGGGLGRRKAIDPMELRSNCGCELSRRLVRKEGRWVRIWRQSRPMGVAEFALRPLGACL